MPSRHSTTPDASTGALDLLRSQPSLARAAAVLAVGQAARQAIRSTTSGYRDRFTYQVRVRSADPIYGAVQDWLIDAMPSHAQRRLLASTESGRAHDYDDDASSPVRAAGEAPTPHQEVLFRMQGTGGRKNS